MATVKGDVHDIGKNIVGVVLQCNGFEVIDLGVMVPWSKILEAANENDADMIGLSGLITPSLDEMVTVAEEMQRAGMTMPLLIGGATTSRAHTALRIAPAYSRAGDPCARRQPRGRRRHRAGQRRPEPRRICRPHRQRLSARSAKRARDRGRASCCAADRGARQRLRAADMRTEPAPGAARRRTCSTTGSSPICVEVIDWTPFFRAWELAGNYPAILDDAVVGESARALFADAQAMLDQIVDEKWLTARGVGRAVAGAPRRRRRGRRSTTSSTRLPFLRQQVTQARGPAEHVPGRFHRAERGDWIGGFAVAIHGIEPHLARFKARS